MTTTNEGFLVRCGDSLWQAGSDTDVFAGEWRDWAIYTDGKFRIDNDDTPTNIDEFSSNKLFRAKLKGVLRLDYDDLTKIREKMPDLWKEEDCEVWRGDG